MAPTCATASVRIVGGSTGPSGDAPSVRSLQADVLDADDARVGLEVR